MTDTKKDWLHGTLETLILRTVAGEPLHGYGIARRIETQSGETIRVEEGSLYPALYRMHKRGWLEADWGVSELGRRAKFYRLTAAGEAPLACAEAKRRDGTPSTSSGGLWVSTDHEGRHT